MAREVEGIRELVAQQVERLEKIFPGKNYLRQKDIIDAFGISRDSVVRWYGVGGQGIDTVSFAWILARRAVKLIDKSI